MLSQTDPNGATTQYLYDPLGRRTETIEPNPTGASGPGPVSGQMYDAMGNVTVSADPLGNVTSYTYNALGELTRQIQETGGKLELTITEFAYDFRGNLQSKTILYGTAATAWQNPFNPYDVNDDGSVNPLDVIFEISALSNPQHSGPLSELSQGQAPPAYYDVLGTGYLTPLDVLAIVAYLEDGSDFVAASDQITSYQYNLLNQLTQETDPDGNVTSYTYDADGNQISLTDPDLNTTTFSYDHLNRLVGESRSTYENATHADVQVSESLAYDAAGNLTRETDFDGRTLSSDRLICRYVSRKTLFPGVARALNGPFCKAGLNNLH